MDRSKPTVLCVQTRNGRLGDTARVLADEGFDVIGTACADCALEFVSHNPVQGVMIDVFLRERTADALRDEMRRVLPGVPVLVFHGGHLLPLEVEILSAWIHRAERHTLDPPEDDFARALTKYSVTAIHPDQVESEAEPALCLR